VFLNNASLGAYPAILQRREDVYRRWGRSRIAAYWSVLSTLVNFREPLSMKVTADGAVHRYRTPLVFVVSNTYQLEQIGLEGADCVQSGRFALFVAPESDTRDLLRHAMRLASRTTVRGEDFDLICGREIVIETSRGARLLARDGERERMAGPFRFVMRPAALRVVVPETA
jgi:diacylglycerol kinase family enzyme